MYHLHRAEAAITKATPVKRPARKETTWPISAEGTRITSVI